MVAAVVGMTGIALPYTVDNLGINTNTADMIADELPWRQTYRDFQAAFPQFSDTLSVVIDGATPDLAEQAAILLAERLAGEPELVAWVYRPGGGEFFDRNALLYLGTDELRVLANRLVEVQPFLGRLERDPSLRGLFDLIGDALADSSAPLEGALASALSDLSAAIRATLEGRYFSLSWFSLVAGDTVLARDTRRFVLVKPRLDYAELLPAGDAIAHIRAVAHDLGLAASTGVRVRVTGGLAMSYEELRSVSRGAAVGAGLALLMVGATLYWGLRSVRLVFATLTTLVVGLIWTGAFATWAVGELNLISIAFAVLYIGLGIDYAVHYALRYRELLGQGHAHPEALRLSAGGVGGSLAICAFTTAVGFYAFVPTDFVGVSQLGLISGTGMLISLVVTLTVLPALMSLVPPRPPRPVDSGRGLALTGRPGFRRVTLAVATLAGVASLMALPHVRFDHNELNLREPGTEALATYQDLLDDPDTSPWTMSVIVAGSDEARRLRPRLEALPSVDKTMGLEDFVPGAQDDKLEILDELSLVMGLLGASPLPAPSVSDLQGSLDRLLRELSARPAAGPDGALAPGLDELAGALDRFRAATAEPGEAQALFDGLRARVLGTLPLVLGKLHQALGAGPVVLEALPPSLAARWVTPDGRPRIEIYPAERLTDQAALERFVAEVTALVPSATDSPVVALKSGQVVVGAFQQALISAAALVALLLWVLLKRARDMLMVMGQLALAGLVTVGAMVALDIPFNYANVITLPLLLGMGVDSGIHVVRRLRGGEARLESVTRSSTGRAVVLSTLTTIVSFGNLALSPHRGTASMGQVLAIGLVLTLLCALFVLPALMRAGVGREAAAARRSR